MLQVLVKMDTSSERPGSTDTSFMQLPSSRRTNVEKSIPLRFFGNSENKLRHPR